MKALFCPQAKSGGSIEADAGSIELTGIELSEGASDASNACTREAFDGYNFPQ